MSGDEALLDSNNYIPLVLYVVQLCLNFAYKWGQFFVILSEIWIFLECSKSRPFSLVCSPIAIHLRYHCAGLFIVCCLIGLNVAVACTFMPQSRFAAFLMLPYLAWLAYMSVINYEAVWHVFFLIRMFHFFMFDTKGFLKYKFFLM
jgi:tryptophan-rich sensory protein